MVSAAKPKIGGGIWTAGAHDDQLIRAKSLGNCAAHNERTHAVPKDKIRNIRIFLFGYLG